MTMLAEELSLDSSPAGVVIRGNPYPWFQRLKQFHLYSKMGLGADIRGGWQEANNTLGVPGNDDYRILGSKDISKSSGYTWWNKKDS